MTRIIFNPFPIKDSDKMEPKCKRAQWIFYILIFISALTLVVLSIILPKSPFNTDPWIFTETGEISINGADGFLIGENTPIEGNSSPHFISADITSTHRTDKFSVCIVVRVFNGEWECLFPVENTKFNDIGPIYNYKSIDGKVNIKENDISCGEKWAFMITKDSNDEISGTITYNINVAESSIVSHIFYSTRHYLVAFIIIGIFFGNKHLLNFYADQHSPPLFTWIPLLILAVIVFRYKPQTDIKYNVGNITLFGKDSIPEYILDLPYSGVFTNIKYSKTNVKLTITTSNITNMFSACIATPSLNTEQELTCIEVDTGQIGWQAISGIITVNGFKFSTDGSWFIAIWASQDEDIEGVDVDITGTIYWGIYFLDYIVFGSALALGGCIFIIEFGYICFLIWSKCKIPNSFKRIMQTIVDMYSLRWYDELSKLPVINITTQQLAQGISAIALLYSMFILLSLNPDHDQMTIYMRHLCVPLSIASIGIYLSNNVIYNSDAALHNGWRLLWIPIATIISTLMLTGVCDIILSIMVHIALLPFGGISLLADILVFIYGNEDYL